MVTILPQPARFVFTVMEPASLLFAALSPLVVSPEWFVAEQIAFSPVEKLTANSRMVAFQLCNLYALLAMIGIAVLYTTQDPKLVRNYLLALAVADIGHVGVTCWVLEYERCIEFKTWNSMTWGNIGATLFLFVTRMAYLSGAFGPDSPPQARKVKYAAKPPTKKKVY